MFNLGDVIWAKMRGYSFPWPSQISNDSEGQFIKPFGRCNQFHVSFLSDNSESWIFPSSLTPFQLHDTGPNNSSLVIPKRWESDFNRALRKANNILGGIQPVTDSPAGPTPGGNVIDSFLRDSRTRSESNRRDSSNISDDDEQISLSQPLPSPFLFFSQSQPFPPLPLPVQHSPSPPPPPIPPPQSQESQVSSTPDQFELADWLDPEVPGPVAQTDPNTSELSVLDTLGAWDCALSRFSTIKDIPRPYRSKWAHIYSGVLILWERASVNQDQQATDRALKALIFLPQLLLRKSGCGGKRGQAGPGLAARFEFALNGDWFSLVDLLKGDLHRLEMK